MKPNDICVEVWNPDSLPIFLSVGGAFPVFLFGVRGGGTWLWVTGLSPTPPRPSSVCRDAGRRRNVSSQSVNPSEIDGWCKHETMGPLLLPSPALFTGTLLLWYHSVFYCWDSRKSTFAFTFHPVLCFSHLEGDLLSYECVLGNMFVAFFKHGSTISEVHYSMPWIPFINT